MIKLSNLTFDDELNLPTQSDVALLIKLNLVNIDVVNKPSLTKDSISYSTLVKLKQLIKLNLVEPDIVYLTDPIQGCVKKTAIVSNYDIWFSLYRVFIWILGKLTVCLLQGFRFNYMGLNMARLDKQTRQ